MTKIEMVISIAAKTGVEQQQVKSIVQMTLDGIIECLATEGRLELRDFGVFEVRTLKARKARNPRTGAEVHMERRPKVCFKAGQIMKLRTDARGDQEPMPSN